MGEVQGKPTGRHRQSEGPQWQQLATNRLRSVVKRYGPQMQVLLDQRANETQTRLLVTEFLVEGLGFDRFADLDLEFQVRGNFVDYGLKVEGELVAFVECKSVATKLAERHLRQIKGYVLDHPDVEWAVLTNGIQWQLWHIGVDRPLSVDHVLDADLLGDTAPGHRAGRLFYLTKESFKHKMIASLWKAKSATSPNAVVDAILRPSVVKVLRREIHAATGHLASVDEIAASVRKVLRSEYTSR